jgi:hypothetical protein
LISRQVIPREYIEMISLVEAVETRLPFFDELRLEARIAVARHVNLDLPALAFDSFLRLAVTRVAGVLTG